MKYCTTSLHFLQVLSTMSSHFQCAGPSHICSVYSWVVYIFGCKCKCDCLHFFLLISFFAHKNETDFCPLFLYPAILLYLFIICNSYLVEYSTHRICALPKSDNVTTSFTTHLWFFPLSFCSWFPISQHCGQIICLVWCWSS